MNKTKNVVYDKWFSDIIGNRSYTLKLDKEFILRSKEDGTDENHWIYSIKNKDTEPLFIYTKVSTQAVEHIQFLESIGFFLIDTNVILKKKIDSQNNKNKKQVSQNIDIRFAKDAVSVARNSFIYSRFHLDPWFTNELANKIKAQWVSNYFDRKRGDQMVVASFDNNVVGFLQILKPDNDHFIIDLIGVDNNYQRKGIAKRMIDYAIEKNSSINYVTVGTQIGNIPSLKLYQKMDYFIDHAKYVFHFHNDKEIT